ncbi:MAG: hypothetical protein M1540_06175 [Candidatus Bathyarchaeota archaeon]|nr:hypothetical protein [Candidatus Bathyarchaeota archaeon]
MSNIDLSQEATAKIKQAINEFKNSLGTYFKDNTIEIKTWKFAVENNETGYSIDAAVKIQIKPKEKPADPTKSSSTTELLG